MSHIAEGLLHAHLDGALGPEEQFLWTDAAAHLEVCEDCRRRLDEAREIRDAAGALLAGATVEPASRPGFDTLVAEAAARRGSAASTGAAARSPTAAPAHDAGPGADATRRWWASPMKLAWAASLVLAVGAGWISRQVMIEDGASLPSLVAEGDLMRTRGSDADSEFRSRREAAGAFEEQVQPRAPDAELEGEDLSDGAAGDETAARLRDRVTTDVAEPETAERERRATDEINDVAETSGDVPARADTESAENDAVRGQALAPRALAAKSADGPAVCYAPTDDRAEDAPAAAEDAARAPAAEAYAANQVTASLRPGRLRLEADGTATLQVEGRPLVGFWHTTDSDGRDVRLTDGERWWELDLVPGDGGLRGSLDAPADEDDPEIGGNRAIESLHFVERACP